MRKVLMVALALCIFGLSARLVAQPPDIKPEHEMLKEAEGTWDLTFKGSGAKGTVTAKMGLGGFWLLEHVKSELGPNLSFEGMGATSYDPAKKKYVNTWIDSMSTSPTTGEGTYDKTTKTMTMLGNMPMDGKLTKVTMITVFKDKDTKVFTMKAPGPDGKELEMFEITYKRKK